jgi:2'-5' RNA ligase
VYRTGLFVVVEADPLVGDFRRRHHAASVARRLPPHVTILFPFVPVAAVHDRLRSDLATHFSAFPAFAGKLARVGQFDRHVWLAPEPRDRFVELIDATRERFPEHARDEAGRGDPVPHLTIAAIRPGDSADRVAELARSELAPLLPFTFTVSDVSLFEEGADGMWHELFRIGLG